MCTHATILNFNQPTIGPIDDEEEEVFAELEDLIIGGEVPSCVGWAITLGEQPKILSAIIIIDKIVIKHINKSSCLQCCIHYSSSNTAESLCHLKILCNLLRTMQAKNVVPSVVVVPASSIHPEKLLTTTLNEIILFCHSKSLTEVNRDDLTIFTL